MCKSKNTKSDMYGCRKNTCVRAKTQNQVCTGAGKIHVQKSQNKIGHVLVQKKYMCKSQNAKSGMYKTTINQKLRGIS